MEYQRISYKLFSYKSFSAFCSLKKILNMQVRNVLSLFCPLTASATTVSHPCTPSLANVDVPSIMSSLGVEDQVKMLPYPQEVGSSIANVGPLDINPAFAKENHVNRLFGQAYKISLF